MTSEKHDISLILNALTCPITFELFVDPVLASDGHTYERSAIVEWIKYHNATSPMTRQTLNMKELKPNRIVKQLADQYRSYTTSKIGKEVTTFTGNGKLLNDEQKLNINRLFSKEKKWLLIYQATKDGFKASDFHRLCDNRGVTLTLIQTRHRFHKKIHEPIFGGYTTVPWSSRQSSYRDSQSFLFLLSDDRVTRFDLRSSDQIAVLHNPTAGPIFGANDIHIFDRANEHHSSFSMFPSSYKDTNGLGAKTISKWRHFQVSEIEIYMVIM